MTPDQLTDDELNVMADDIAQYATDGDWHRLNRIADKWAPALLSEVRRLSGELAEAKAEIVRYRKLAEKSCVAQKKKTIMVQWADGATEMFVSAPFGTSETDIAEVIGNTLATVYETASHMASEELTAQLATLTAERDGLREQVASAESIIELTTVWVNSLNGADPSRPQNELRHALDTSLQHANKLSLAKFRYDNAYQQRTATDA